MASEPFAYATWLLIARSGFPAIHRVLHSHVAMRGSSILLVEDAFGGLFSSIAKKRCFVRIDASDHIAEILSFTDC